MGPRCSFCGSATGPFQEVGGAFPLQMCAGCQAARSASGTRGLLAPPSELLAHHDPGQPELQWTCALCEYRCFVPTWLEDHTAAAHPGWVARFEVVRPYPRQVLRVVYRRAGAQRSGEGSPSPTS